MSATYIMLAVVLIVRLWVAGQLLATGRKFHLRNLYWLSAWSFIVSGYILFAPTTPPTALSNPLIFYVGTVFGQFFLIMFMHTTFYRGKQSPVLVFVFIFMLSLFGVIYLMLLGDVVTAGLISQGFTVLNWIWHLILAWQAYSAISLDPEVENWVKGRYRLMIAFSLVIILGNLVSLPLATPMAKDLPQIVTQAYAVLNLIGVVLLFLVWVMPEPFRVWLNRHFVPPAPVDNETPVDASALLNIFATAMVANNSLRMMPCMYAMRSTIAKIAGTEDADAVDAYIARMTYLDWEQLFLHPELIRSLSHFANSDVAGQALANAQKALVEKQSLLTLSAH